LYVLLDTVTSNGDAEQHSAEVREEVLAYKAKVGSFLAAYHGSDTNADDVEVAPGGLLSIHPRVPPTNIHITQVPPEYSPDPTRVPPEYSSAYPCWDFITTQSGPFFHQELALCFCMCAAARWPCLWPRRAVQSLAEAGAGGLFKAYVAEAGAEAGCSKLT
jgi:hypothetical protein